MTTPSFRIDPNAPTSDDQTSWTRGLPDDGSFDVAGAAEWMAQRQMQRDPTLEPRVRATVRGIVGPSFSDDELRSLEMRALHAVDLKSALSLGNIQAGNPVQISPQQRQTIQNLLGQIGQDDLAKRAQSAFGQAVTDGKVRVR